MVGKTRYQLDPPPKRWVNAFEDELRGDRVAANALRVLLDSRADVRTIRELLYHHVRGEYGLGANPRRWRAFRSRLESLRRTGLAFEEKLNEVTSLPLFFLCPLVLQAFTVRKDGYFTWEMKRKQNPAIWAGSIITQLRDFGYYISRFIESGDQAWQRQDFKNVNLVILSTYIHHLAGKWHDVEIGHLLFPAFKATGKKCPLKNPAAAVARIRQRFRGPDSKNNDQRRFAKTYLRYDVVSGVGAYLGTVDDSADPYGGSILSFFNEYYLQYLKM